MSVEITDLPGLESKSLFERKCLNTSEEDRMKSLIEEDARLEKIQTIFNKASDDKFTFLESFNVDDREQIVFNGLLNGLKIQQKIKLILL